MSATMAKWAAACRRAASYRNGPSPSDRTIAAACGKAVPPPNGITLFMTGQLASFRIYFRVSCNGRRRGANKARQLPEAAQHNVPLEFGPIHPSHEAIVQPLPHGRWRSRHGSDQKAALNPSRRVNGRFHS
jgi:hypothetical protein